MNVPSTYPRKDGVPFAVGEAAALLARRIIAEQREVFRRQTKGVSGGKDPEAVHDARVAVRRMRTSLYFFTPWLPAAPAARLQKRLRAAGRALGPVRDLEVGMMFVRKHAEHLAPAASEPLLRHLRQEWRSARKDLLDYYESKGYGKLLDTLSAFLAADAHDESPLSEVLPVLILQADAEVQRFADTLHPTPPVEHLHALRIAIKHYRYLLEFTRHVTSPTVEPLIAALVEMQDLLGDLHDADVSSHLAYALLRQPEVELSAGERAALLAYAGGLTDQRQELTRTFLAADPGRSPWVAFQQPGTQRLRDDVLALLRNRSPVSAPAV